MLFSIDGKTPLVHPTAYIAPTAVLIGDVTIGPRASVWFGAVLRGDAGAITIGSDVNIQDNAVVHEETVIGTGCTLAHLCLVHKATLGEDVLIGNGALVFGDVQMGANVVIGAGAVISGPLVIPPATLWLGVPARQVRDVDDNLRALANASRTHYVDAATRYRSGLTPADAVAEAWLRDNERKAE